MLFIQSLILCFRVCSFGVHALCLPMQCYDVHCIEVHCVHFSLHGNSKHSINLTYNQINKVRHCTRPQPNMGKEREKIWRIEGFERNKEYRRRGKKGWEKEAVCTSLLPITAVIVSPGLSVSAGDCPWTCCRSLVARCTCSGQCLLGDLPLPHLAAALVPPASCPLHSSCLGMCIYWSSSEISDCTDQPYQLSLCP